MMTLRFLRTVGFVLTAAALTAALSGCSDKQGSAASATSSESAKPVVTVYSARKEHLIKPLFDRYEALNNVEIRYLTDEAGPLLTRLKAEGKNTEADLFMTVDAGYLWQAANEGVLQPLDSEVLKANIPANLRAPNGEWFGLSLRARTMVYATDRVQPSDLSTYEALADPEWEGRLCLRTSKKVYNQSLVATMINTLGEEKTEALIRGWVANLATDPFSNDTKAMEAVAAGQCDVTVVNTYYFGRLKKEKPDINLAIFWPNQNDRGVHVNISGAGITRYAKNPDAARQLLEWLSSPEAQHEFAELNQEYPANPNVKPSAEVASWGEFKADNINVAAAGRLQGEAIRLMDRAGYR